MGHVSVASWVARRVKRVLGGCLPAALCLLMLSVAVAHAEDIAQPTAPQPTPRPTPSIPNEARSVEGPDGAPEAAVQPVASLLRRHFEPSYMAYPIGLSGLDSLLVEVSLAPHFYVSQPGWRVAFVLTPKIVVRMFRQESAPVKTPSYMPRMMLYAWFEDELAPGEMTAYVSLGLSHHSNGQSGAFMRDNGAINHETGNFSTNYFELSGYVMRRDQSLFGWNQLSLVWHPGFNQEPGLRGRYGLLRTYLTTTLLQTSKPVDSNLQIKIGAVLDRMLVVSDNAALRALERFPISIQYTVAIPGVDLGLYAGYYMGHDYYNIWFDRWTHVLQVGISGRVGPSADQ